MEDGPSKQTDRADDYRGEHNENLGVMGERNVQRNRASNYRTGINWPPNSNLADRWSDKILG